MFAADAGGAVAGTSKFASSVCTGAAPASLPSAAESSAASPLVGTPAASTSVGKGSEGVLELCVDRERPEGARRRLPIEVGTGGAVSASRGGGLWLEGAAPLAPGLATAAPASVREGTRCRDGARCMSLCVNGCSKPHHCHNDYVMLV